MVSLVCLKVITFCPTLLLNLVAHLPAQSHRYALPEASFILDAFSGYFYSFTFIRIFSFRRSGEGKRPDSSMLTSDRSSLSPSTSIRYWAIFFCWGTLQWFSMDRITGYLVTIAKRQASQPYQYFPLQDCIIGFHHLFDKTPLIFDQWSLQSTFHDLHS